MKVLVLFLVLLLVNGIASVCMSTNGTTHARSVSLSKSVLCY